MAYRGFVAPLPVGQQGFTGTQNPSQAQPGHFIFVDGAELDGGIIRKEGGASKLNIVPLTEFVPDPQTKILLHFDGADMATTFPDSSIGAHTFTAAGNAQIDTAESEFGGASGLFDGTGDWITTPDHADFAFGSGDWTIDFWFNCIATTGSQERICGQNDSGAGARSFAISRTTGNIIQAIVTTDGTATTSIDGTTQFTDLLNPGWHHCAFVRTGNTLKLFLDGVQEGGDVAFSGTVFNSSQVLGVGTTGAQTTNPWTGWIDEFRLSVGVARWTAAFTPPTAAYSNLIAGLAVTVQSGISWSATPGVQYDVVFLSDGTIRRDAGDGTFPTILVDELNADQVPPPWFLVAGGETVGEPRKLMCFSGTNQVQIVEGTGAVMAPISGPAADWSASFPTFGVLHGFRVWAGGNASDPHRIYYSTNADHEDFATGGTLAIFPGEGEGLAGGISMRGALILFKYPAGIYIVNTSDPDPANWSVIPLTRAVGTLNQHSLVHIENDVLYMDRAGNVHSLQATQEFGDINSSNIGDFSDIPPFMRANINLSQLRRAQALWYQGKRQAWFALPRIGSTQPDFRLILGFSDPSPQGAPAPRFFMSRRDICPSIWIRPDTSGVPKPAFGDTTGFVWLADQELRSKDGVGYPITFETAATDLSFLDQQLATRSKAGHFLELVYEPRGEWDLTVEVHWDDTLTSVIQFDMGSGGAVLGSFILDTDVLAASAVRSSRRKINGSGRRVKLIGENAGINQDVSLSAFHLSFALMDERDG